MQSKKRKKIKKMKIGDNDWYDKIIWRMNIMINIINKM